MSKAEGAVWLRFLRSPLGSLSALLLAGLGVMAILGPILWGKQAGTFDINALSQGPSAGHVFGTDALGRDIFARLLVATRRSLELALLATSIGVAIGLALGTAPGLFGRSVGRLFSAAINIAVAFPGLLLVLFFAVIFGVGTRGAVLALAVAMAPFYARLTQTLVASVAGRDFVSAASVAGVGRLRVLFRHVLPNIGEQLIINAMIGAGSTLLSFAGLSFLGIGVQAPSYDWGVLLNEGLQGIYVNPAGALAPAVAVIIAGLAFNLFGEAAAQLIGRQSSPRLAGRPASAVARSSAREASASPVLLVENLKVEFPTAGGWIAPVRGVSLRIEAGESVGVVGESGSGKSLTALAVASLIEWPGVVTADRLEFQGQSLISAASGVLQRLGTSLAMVFQDPMASLNPALRIGTQLSEVSTQHEGLTRREARARAIAKLNAVRVPDAGRRVRQFPHEFSGGMRQRVMIAVGLMGTPRLIVADEPTTALDVTVQWHVLSLLQEVRAAEGAALLLISHDISVIARTCDRVLVMYAGRVVEELPSAALARHAKHPYTRALLRAVPDMTTDREAPLAVIPGRPPEPAQLPSGCAFAPRCGFADERCTTDEPLLTRAGDRQRVACWHPLRDDSDPVAVAAAPVRGARQRGNTGGSSYE